MKIIRCIDDMGHISTAAQFDNDTFIKIQGNIPEKFELTKHKVKPVKILIPYQPKSIIGIGANYRGSFKDNPLPEYPVVFFKSYNTLQNPGDPVILPRKSIQAETVKFEGELAVIIGKEGKNIDKSKAMDHIFGYTIANDVSASDWQGERVGMQWCKGKGFDTFCPLGPAIVTSDEIPEPADLRIVTYVNGEKAQDESVRGMCFSIPELISFLSAGHTLEAGDLILTGTPPGAYFIDAGSITEITIKPIGTLSNPWIIET